MKTKIKCLTNRKNKKCLKNYVIFVKIQNAHTIAKDFVKELFMPNVERKSNNKPLLALNK